MSFLAFSRALASVILSQRLITSGFHVFLEKGSRQRKVSNPRRPSHMRLILC